jgi:ketopantoate reductase
MIYSSYIAVYRSPSEAPHTFDYIVCAHKAINPSAIPPIFQSVADSNTTFVIMQNGVGNEDPFRSTYPHNTIISGVVWIGATQTSPGLIRHMQAENTEIGLFSNPESDPEQEKGRLEHFASIMRHGGTNISVEENVQVKRWEKVVWNAAWNTIGKFVLEFLVNCCTNRFAVSLAPAVDFHSRCGLRQTIGPARDQDLFPLSRNCITS